jgi:LmbE family N-acetylglucosaminyl deacetylase
VAEPPARVLAVTAHPDDTEFGFGGTIARWAAEGSEIYYLVCTNGDKGTSDPHMTPEKLARIREEEQRAAARVLGVREVFFLGYPDGELEDTRELRGKIVRYIRLLRPNLVITMNPYPVSRFVQHRDHRIAGLVTIDAVYPYARDHLHFAEHIAEGLQPHKVEELYVSGVDNPDTFVDITDYIEKKIEALRCHRSQVRDADGEAFAARIRAMAARTGERFGVPFAEAFQRIQLRP